MAHHDAHLKRPKHPSFMRGRLLDVWFIPMGRNRMREKVSVALDLASIKKWAHFILQERVKERYGNGRLASHGMLCRIDVTERPSERVIWSIRFDGKKRKLK